MLSLKIILKVGVMWVKGFLWGVVMLAIMSSCSSNRQVTSNNVKAKKELSKDKEQQYYYYFLEANRKKLLGDLNGALAIYYQCLELYPDSDASMAEIAKINEITQNYDVAIKYAKNAAELDPKNKWYQLNLAKLYIIKNDFENAIIIYEDLNKNFKDDIEIPYNLAALHNRTGNYKRSIELYDQIEKQTGVNESLSLGKQQLYLQIHNKTRAYAEIENLIKHYPNKAQYYGIIAEMYTNDNLFLKAQESYNKLFKIDSTNNLGQLSIIDFYRKKINYDKAFEMISKVIENENIPIEQKVMVFVSLLNNQSEFNIYKVQIQEKLKELKIKYPKEKDVYTLQADFFIKENNLTDAQKEIEFIVDNFTGNVALWEQLLSIYSYNNNMQELYLRSETAIDSFPEHALFFLFRGVSANRLGKSTEAITTLKAGLKTLENDEKMELDFFSNLGEAYHENKDYKQSDYYFDLVLKKDPNNLYIINNYSYYLSLREERLEYAESISKKTILAEPENETFLDTYAWILYKLERYQEALIYITKAVKNGGIDSEVVVEHYGDILFKNGEIERAVELWKLSKEMGNNSELLLEKINQSTE
ncbi:MAG: tetratricopeptide repeat protein [Bacteroidales bacterium]|nr:tetratricopeptide repeat protein [Bacteroidales bacterium]